MAGHSPATAKNRMFAPNLCRLVATVAEGLSQPEADPTQEDSHYCEACRPELRLAAAFSGSSRPSRDLGVSWRPLAAAAAAGARLMADCAFAPCATARKARPKRWAIDADPDRLALLSGQNLGPNCWLRLPTPLRVSTLTARNCCRCLIREEPLPSWSTRCPSAAELPACPGPRCGFSFGGVLYVASSDGRSPTAATTAPAADPAAGGCRPGPSSHCGVALRLQLGVNRRTAGRWVGGWSPC